MRLDNITKTTIMLFKDFSQTCEQLEETSGRLDMIDIISQVLPTLSSEELPVFVRFVMGRIFPDWSSKNLASVPIFCMKQSATWLA